MLYALIRDEAMQTRHLVHWVSFIEAIGLLVRLPRA